MLSDLNPRHFALVVGNSRSGTTVVGSIIDSHPRMVCANESKASRLFWADLSREQILSEILTNSESNYENGRRSERRASR